MIRAVLMPFVKRDEKDDPIRLYHPHVVAGVLHDEEKNYGPCPLGTPGERVEIVHVDFELTSGGWHWVIDLKPVEGGAA